MSFLGGDDIFVALTGSGMQKDVVVSMGDDNDRVKGFDRAAVGNLQVDDDYDAVYVAVGGYVDIIDSIDDDDTGDVITVFGSVGNGIELAGDDELYVGGCAQVGNIYTDNADGDQEILFVAASGSVFGNDEAFDSGIGEGGITMISAASYYVRFAGFTRGLSIQSSGGTRPVLDVVFYSSAVVYGTPITSYADPANTGLDMSLGSMQVLMHAGFEAGSMEIVCVFLAPNDDFVIVIKDDVTFGALSVPTGAAPKLQIGNNFIANYYASAAESGNLKNLKNSNNIIIKPLF